LEKIIVVAVKEKALAVRIDHQTNCLRFGEVALESDHMRTQLTTLATQLVKVNAIIKPMASDEKAVKARANFFAKVRSTMEHEHLTTLNRKNIIEYRKEEQEKREIEVQKQAELQLIEAEKERQALEKERQDQERKERERKKREKMLGELNLITTKELLKKSGVDTSNIKTLTERETDNLLTKAQKEAEAAAAAEEARKVEQFKKFDYTIRAVRDSELPKLAEEREKEIAAAKLKFEKDTEVRAEESKKQFIVDTELKGTLSHMFSFTKSFESSIIAGRKAQYEALLQAKRQEAFNRKVARARRLKFEKEEEEEQMEYERMRAEEDARMEKEREAEEEERARENRARQLEDQALAREKAAAEEAAMKKREQMLEEAKQIKAQRERDESSSSQQQAPAATQGDAPSSGEKWRPRSMMDRSAPSTTGNSGAGGSDGKWRAGGGAGGEPSRASNEGGGGGRWGGLGGGGGSNRDMDRNAPRREDTRRNEPERSESGRWRK
jgi:hypothetical protein